MSDDTLLDRGNELQRKLNWALRHAGMGQGTQQMTMMLQLIEAERRERIFMDQWHLAETTLNEPIETDPDLRDAERAARERAKPAEPVRVRPRIHARRPVPVASSHQFGPALRPTAAPVLPGAANEKPPTEPPPTEPPPEPLTDAPQSSAPPPDNDKPDA